MRRDLSKNNFNIAGNINDFTARILFGGLYARNFFSRLLLFVQDFVTTKFVKG